MINLTTIIKLNKVIGRVTGPAKTVTFEGERSQPRRILILFPVSDPWFTQSMYVMRELERYPSKNIEYVIFSGHKADLPTPSHKVIYYSMAADSPQHIDVEHLCSAVNRKKFDAVINLAPFVDLGMARVISATKAPLRMGLAGPGADDLYNIVIQTESQFDYTGAYDQFLALCDFGPVDPHPDFHKWH